MTRNVRPVRSRKMKLVVPDKIMIVTVIVLLAVGLLFVFSSSSVTTAMTSAFNNDPFYYLKRQVGWMLAGLLAAVVAMVININLLRRYSAWLYLISVVLLALVLFTNLGSEAGGATRWLEFGQIRFSPSEIAKIAMVLAVAHFIAANRPAIKQFIQVLLPCLIMLLIIVGLIYKQPDLGTTAVIVGTFFIMFFVGGARILHLLVCLAAAAAGLAISIYVAPYRMDRYIAFLDPWSYASDEGFQIIQSLYALGSGGWTGVGLGESMQKLFHLPAQHTDFIFSIIGEEWGFLRAVLIIFLFFLFVWRGLVIAWEAPDFYMAMVAVGLTGLIGLQAAVNIAVAIGAMPVSGLTLPFISYGGTSLVFTLISVGILLNISRYKAKA